MLIYDWSQNQPEQLGSSIFKTHDLILGSTVLLSVAILWTMLSITVGNLLRTTLTPMTFSRPRFNGVQIDFMADKYAGTSCLAASDPILGATLEPERRTNTTTMFGGQDDPNW